MGLTTTVQDWLDALHASGWQGRKEGTKRWRGPCPVCGGEAKSRRFWVEQGDAQVLAGCNKGCGFEDLARAVGATGNGIQPRQPTAAETRAEAERQREKLDALRRRWKNAARLTEGLLHPYLESKGFDGPPPGLRTDGETLLVPMRDSERRLMGLQQIWGTRSRYRKQFQKGSQPSGTYFAVAPRKDSARIYIAEGLATGHTVALAMPDAAVAIAFTAGNLASVARTLRTKYPDKELVIAADNDRWKDPAKNPGVTAAKLAALEVKGCQIAIPDFADLSDVQPGEKGPTDYDDLRMREGLDAVRRWLDPAMAEHAVTTAPQEADEEPDQRDEAEAEPDAGPDPEPDSDSKSRRSPGSKRKDLRFFDNELADLLTADDLERWIFDPGRGWYGAPVGSWDWRYDDCAAALRNLIRILAEDLAAEMGLPLKLRNAHISGAVQLVRDKVLAKPKWDGNPMIAGLPGGGVLDLTTGDARPAKRDEFVTRRLGVKPDPKAGDPIRFLALIDDMVGNPATARWLLHWMAYTLTGHNIVSDHSVPMLCGAGGAGKSTLMDILRYLWGSYVCKLPEDVMVARRGARERHPEWMLGLDGGRLGLGTEIPERGRVRSALFKELTGGEPVKANLMRMNSVEFIPTAKYLMYGNAPPLLPGWDSGLKRRLVFVQCHAKPEAERVEGLSASIIQDEGPAILHYLANLCALDHDRHAERGKWLPSPSSASKTETADLFAANNPLADAIASCVNITGEAYHWTASKDIHAAVSKYYDAEGLGKAPTAHRIGPALRNAAADAKLSVQRHKPARVWGWLGVQIHDQDQNSP